jgi:hypothetical protein
VYCVPEYDHNWKVLYVCMYVSTNNNPIYVGINMNFIIHVWKKNHYLQTAPNKAHGEVYSIQLYVIKFDSDLLQFGGFLRVLRFPPPRYNWIIFESGVKHHNPNLKPIMIIGSFQCVDFFTIKYWWRYMYVSYGPTI